MKPQNCIAQKVIDLWQRAHIIIKIWGAWGLWYITTFLHIVWCDQTVHKNGIFKNYLLKIVNWEDYPALNALRPDSDSFDVFDESLIE